MSPVLLLATSGCGLLLDLQSPVGQTDDASTQRMDAEPEDAGAVPPDMVLVAEGPFQMGCEPGTFFCATDEQPVHEVVLSSYVIDRTEVTQAEYQACMDAGACTRPEIDGKFNPANVPKHPVSGLAWEQAVAYCESQDKRLPTEAEWEKAARGTDQRIFPWGDQDPTCELTLWYPCPGIMDDVGTHPDGASPYGVQDAAGNAGEWVSDWYSASYYADSPSRDPEGPPDTGVHVARGGSAGSGEKKYLRTMDRYSVPEGDTDGAFGVRCARSYP